MSHRDTVFERAARLHRAGVLDGLAGRRVRERRARHLRHPVPPRGRPHARTARTIAHSASSRDICGCDLTWSAASIIEEQIERIRAQVGDRQGDLRAVRRRRLVRRRAARAPRGRRPADLRVRRPRPDAQERGRAGRRRLPRALRDAARRRRRRGPLPRARWPASPIPRPSARHRRRVHPRLRGGGRARSATRTTSCRARCTPT